MPESTAAAPRVSIRLIRVGSPLSLVVLALLAWITAAFTHRSLRSLIAAAPSSAADVLLGITLGVVLAGVVAVVVLRVPAASALRAIIERVLATARPSTLDFVLLAACAGVGEELFFRAALQPVTGIIVAALAFAILHTGVPKSRGVVTFAAYVFAMGLILGSAFQLLGLGAAMAMHAVFDWSFLVLVSRALRAQASSAIPSAE